MKLDSTKLTKHAKKIIDKKFGYRCEEQSTGWHAPYDILDFEINELGNDDIITTMKRLYDYDFTNVDDLDAKLKEYFQSGYQLLWLADDPLTTVEEYSDGHQRVKSLKEAKHEDGSPIVVRAYYLPTDFLVLSDIDADGQLFAFSDEVNIVYSQCN